MARTKSTPKSRAELLAEYATFSDDQLVDEKTMAARLDKSRAWLQWKRVTGGGPKFQRSASGRVHYFKRDGETYLTESLTSYDSTSEYPPRVESQVARSQEKGA